MPAAATTSCTATSGTPGPSRAPYVRAPLVVTYTGSDLLGDRARRRAADAQERGSRRGTFQQSRPLRGRDDHAVRADGVRAARGPARARNHVVPTGIPLDQFRPMPRDEARRRLGWPLDERVVLWAANPARGVKNYPLAVETHARAAGARSPT